MSGTGITDDENPSCAFRLYFFSLDDDSDNICFGPILNTL